MCVDMIKRDYRSRGNRLPRDRRLMHARIPLPQERLGKLLELPLPPRPQPTKAYDHTWLGLWMLGICLGGLVAIIALVVRIVATSVVAGIFLAGFVALIVFAVRVVGSWGSR